MLHAGFALTPGPLTAAALAPVAGRLADRFGQRVVAAPGGLLFAAGAALLAVGCAREPAYLAALPAGDDPHRRGRRALVLVVSAPRPSPSCRGRCSPPAAR